MEVLGVEDGVVGPVATPLYFPRGPQSGIDRVAELGDHHQVLDGPVGGLQVIIGTLSPRQARHPSLRGSG